MEPPSEVELPSVATLDMLLRETPAGTLPELPGGDPAVLEQGRATREAMAEWGGGLEDAASQEGPGGAGGARWGGGEVDCCSAAALTYDAFVRDHMARNRPVLIQGAASGWPAAREWRSPGGGVAMAELAERYGDAAVQVTAMPAAGDAEGGGWECEEMSLREYAAWWARWHAGQAAPGEPAKYLKDWHFAHEFRHQQFRAYQLPKYFREDWLNGFYDSRAAAAGGAAAAADYRFVYCGPAGTWTPLHADVLRSFSWSANVAGRKRWLLLPPEHSFRLYDATGQRLASSLRAEDMGAAAAARYPWLEGAARYVTEVIQMPGDALFVPSGWHHMVENLDDCLSINHNWINQHNVHWTLAFLQRGYAEAAASIADCRPLCRTEEEFEELVQRNLGANCGLDAAQLLELLACAVPGAGEGAPSGTESRAAWLLSREHSLARIQGCLRALRAEATDSSPPGPRFSAGIQRHPATCDPLRRVEEACVAAGVATGERDVNRQPRDAACAKEDGQFRGGETDWGQATA